MRPESRCRYVAAVPVTLVYEVVVPLVEVALIVVHVDLVKVWRKPGELVDSKGTGRHASDVVSGAVLGVDPCSCDRQSGVLVGNGTGDDRETSADLSEPSRIDSPPRTLWSH